MFSDATTRIKAMCSGSWLSRHRILTYGLMFGAGQLCLFLYLGLKFFGVLPGPSLYFGSDFLTFFTAGRLENLGKPWVAYDIIAQFAEQARVTHSNHSDGFVVFPYPPAFILLCAPLAKLPFYPALVIWNFGTLAFWLLALRIASGSKAATGILATFPAAFTNFYIGQTAFLSSGLIGLGLILLEGHPFLAGIVFGFLCYKPHFLIILPISLIAGRCWRGVLGLALCSLGITLLSLELLGWHTWQAYLHFVPVMSRITFNGVLGYWSYATPFAATRLLGGSMMVAMSVQIGVILLSALGNIYVWWRSRVLATRALALIGGTLLAAPILSSYDLTIATVAIAWIARDHRRLAFPGWVKIVLCIDWAIGFSGLMFAHHANLPLFPLVGLSLLGLGLMRVGQAPVPLVAYSRT